MARRASAPSHPVVISDASAVRALAHPARLVVIDALYAGRVLTATELAEIAGTTPSAMSYHLRALEKYGLVVRAEQRGDGRERPWARAGDTLSIDIQGSGGSGGALAAAGVLVENSLQMDLRRLLASMRADAEAGPDDPWSGTTTYVRDQLVLTPDEARQFRADLERLTQRYSRERRPRPPRGSLTFSFSTVLVRETDEA